MATIRDISKAAQVSPGTVSRALNPEQQSSVSKATRLKVQKIAREMAYQLPQKKTKTPPKQKKLPPARHFVVLNTHTPEEEAKDEYWRLVRLGISEQAKKENIVIDQVIDMNNGLDPATIAPYDAVLIVGTPSLDSIRQLKQANPNIVVVDGGNYFEDSVDIVSTNFDELTKAILDTLAAHTTKDIALINGPRIELQLDGSRLDGAEDPRTLAYREWVELHHQKQLFKQTAWSNTAAKLACDELLAQNGANLGAIVVASDSLFVIGVMKSLAEHHLVVGRDIFLVSYDDADFAQFLTPALSTAWLPKAELGAAAVIYAKTLSETTDKTWTTRVILPGKIKYRETFDPKRSS